jgi:hypothetical protein
MKRMIIILSALILCLAVSSPAGTEQTSVPAQLKDTSMPKAEAQICKAVTDRNPVDVVSSAGTDIGQLYCWCKVTGGTGEQTIKHVWSHGGKVVAEVSLSIKGSSWRTWSAKKIDPSMTGQWEVKVVDATGTMLANAAFTIGEEKK